MNYYNDTTKILDRIQRGDLLRFEGQAYKILEIQNHSQPDKWKKLHVKVEHVGEAEGDEKHWREIEGLSPAGRSRSSEKGEPLTLEDIYKFSYRPDWREKPENYQYR